MHNDFRPQSFIRPAIEAVHQSARLVLQNMDRLDRLTSMPDSSDSPYTLQLEKTISDYLVGHLQQKFPDHSFFDACSKPHELNLSDDVWIVGGLCGVENFIHGLPLHSLSLAYMHKKQLMVSVIHNPVTDETFTALQGQSARLNDKRIRVGMHPSKLAKPLLDMSSQTVPKPLQSMMHTLRTRHLTNPSLSIAYVASGKLAVCYHPSIPYHQFAAAKLIAQEARAKLSAILSTTQPLTNEKVLCVGPSSMHSLTNAS